MADPQVNPNALGAPTEGFGQTVTFAFDPRGVTPTLQLAESVPANVSVQGAGRAQLAEQANVKAPPRDGTADLLMKVGEAILAPKIEEQRNAKFIEGVSRAMQGEAAKDIAAQQPWYSRIFGDTPAVAGARAYEVQAKVNEVVAAQTANIDKIKTLTPDEASKHFSSLITGKMTGDASTDALVTKGLLEQLPGLLKAQAKAHHGYVQKTAMDNLSRNMATAGDALQQAGQLYAEDTLNEKDMALRQRSFIATIAPPEGINEENYAKALAANLRRAADSGQFHVISAVRAAGLFDVLTPEQQNVANAAINAAAVKHRDQYAYKYAKEIAELRSDAAHLPAGMTPNDVAARYQKMNAAYQKLSGSPVGLFTSDEVANGLTGTLNYLKSEEAAAARNHATLASREATAQAKQLAQMELADALDRHITEGTVFLAKTVTKATDDQIHTAAYKAFTTDPKVGTDLLRNNFVRGGYVNPILKEEFRGKLRSSEGRDAPTADFFQAVDTYTKLAQGAGGMALADAYFGDYAPRINRFVRMTGGNPMNENVADAFMAAMDRTDTMKPSPLPSKDRSKLAKEIAKSEGFSMPRWMGGKVTYREDTLDALSAIAEQNIEDWRGVGGVGDAEAVKRGIAGAVASKQVELIGGFAIRRGTAGGGQSLRELAGTGPDGSVLAVPAGNEDAYFESFLKTKLKAEGTDLGGAQVIIHHAGKVGGTDQFAVAVSKDGHTELRRFTAAEWQRFAADATKHDTSPGEKSPWAFGPAITYKPEQGAPSIYADAEKWAAFRAEQRRKAQLKTK